MTKLWEIVVIPPDRAVICGECGAVSNSPNDDCPACASHGCLMNISKIFNRADRPQVARLLQARADAEAAGVA